MYVLLEQWYKLMAPILINLRLEDLFGLLRWNVVSLHQMPTWSVRIIKAQFNTDN
jgi:hypothetical protein